ncbi:hypothetical protein DFI02_12916 [Rhizobium sp. PP-F2F-G20b]|nr:hypothetical protein DFI02_12916 [Rhizobium sp. PP-F2F-G20b]
MANGDTESSSTGSTGEKLTLRLTGETREALEWVASKYGNISLAEAIRRAIGTEKYLLEEKDKGSTLIIEERGGRVKEIVLR